MYFYKTQKNQKQVNTRKSLWYEIIKWKEQKYRKKAAYLVRIAVNNEHCVHVFEKMGAVLVGFDSRDKEQIDALEQRLNEEKLKKNKDAINYLQRSIDYYTEKSKNICEYKLYTSSICD